MKDMKKEVKEYTDKKPMKEFNDMDKSCKTCSKVKNCGMYSYAIAIGMTRDDEGWYCKNWKPKKKPVKLYRYTYEYHGAIYQSEWTSEDDDLYFGNDTQKKLLKTETKEIEI